MKLIYFLSLFYLISINACAVIQNSEVPNDDVSSWYGYTSEVQKDALNMILRASGALSPQQSLNDLFGLDISIHSDAQKAQKVIQFAKMFQEFVKTRTGKQERWESAKPNWTINPAQTVLLRTAFDQLGFIQEVKPNVLDPVESLCVFGATKDRVDDRIQYAKSLFFSLESVKYLILLGGERYVSFVGVDGSEQYLHALAKKLKIPLNQLTETEILIDSYNNYFLMGIPEKKTKPQLVVLSTPRNNLPRPTTETTLQTLINWLSHLSINDKAKNRLIFISNQPYVPYQKAVTAEVMSRLKYPLQFEVVGPAVDQETQISDLADALASTVWAKTPELLRQLKSDYLTKENQQNLNDLFGLNPLIYQSLIELNR